MPKLIVDLGLADSTSEARRLIGQGAVRADGDVVSELDVPHDRLVDIVLQVGRRRFVRLRAHA
jgi:tyrosyl-tRNA synthetase